MINYMPMYLKLLTGGEVGLAYANYVCTEKSPCECYRNATASDVICEIWCLCIYLYVKSQAWQSSLYLTKLY